MAKVLFVSCFHTILIEIAFSQMYAYPGQPVPEGIMFGNTVNSLPGVPFGNGVSGGFNGVVGGFNGVVGGFNGVVGGLPGVVGGLPGVVGGLPGVVGGLPGAVNSVGLTSGINGVGVNQVSTVGLPNFGNAVLGNSFGNPLSGVNSLPDFGPSFSSGPFIVNSFSPISPTGLSVVSENKIEGAVNVYGQLPFLSVVAFEGALPSAGSGIATCGCGSGTIGIINDGLPNQPNIIPKTNYGNFVANV